MDMTTNPVNQKKSQSIQKSQSGKKLTPLMQQYWEIKSEHLDKVLLFRMGDFFEMFHQDAETAAPILNIALTARNKKSADDTKMCGVPHHSIAGPIAKLLSQGYKVAICDQIEDPKQAKGIVKRAVTRILSPGMVYDPETLDQLQANYLCSYDEQSLSFMETSTGETFYYSTRDSRERERIMLMLQPVELVLGVKEKQKLMRDRGIDGPHITAYEWDPQSLSSHYFELPQSAQRLLSYASYMQGPEILKSLAPFEERKLQSRMELPGTVVRHLELFSTYKGDNKGSLIHAINRTKTSAGARLLKNWLAFPLADPGEIEKRLDRVEFWHKHPSQLGDLRQQLGQMGDVERRLGKVANPGCNARDLLSLSQSLRAGLAISPLCGEGEIEASSLEVCQQLVESIERTIVDEPPLGVKDGGLIRQGVSPQLDELISLTRDSQKLLVELEVREKEATGIPTLKVRYNNVFGYYIEVTKTHSAKVPERYMRKQTLTNAERYTTDELQELEDKVISAKSRRGDHEYEIFCDLRQRLMEATADLLGLSRKWSELDVISSLAWLAIEYNYRRPRFSKAGELKLQASRHPVIEQEVEHPFTPNSLDLKKSDCLLLTGPNMAGKSTLMRQVAVVSILAQMGSFVPAESACLPVFNRIFTRIGASDYLAEGLSTFMVEMKETAEMLKLADENSLVILDEVGRGTSTYDGMSLAQAILEFLVNKCRSMTLFATHYHELTRLEAQYSQIHNAHMSIREKGGDISFLHTLVPGPANKSYGIHVARLAGLPVQVTQRAKGLLDKHESFQSPGPQMTLLEMEHESADLNESPAELPQEMTELVEKIKKAPVQQMTPLEALNQIAKWQQDLS